MTTWKVICWIMYVLTSIKLNVEFLNFFVFYSFFIHTLSLVWISMCPDREGKEERCKAGGGHQKLLLGPWRPIELSL